MELYTPHFNQGTLRSTQCGKFARCSAAEAAPSPKGSAPKAKSESVVGENDGLHWGFAGSSHSWQVPLQHSQL